MIFRIYSLHDPRKLNEPRYVGQTGKTIEERLAGHLKETAEKYGTDKTTHKCNWIGSLLKQGITPVCILIEETDESKQEEMEKFWISEYRFKGHRLTNGTGGGDKGKIITEEIRKKISESKKGKPSWNKGKKIGPRPKFPKIEITSEMEGTIKVLRKIIPWHRLNPAKPHQGKSFSYQTCKKMSISHKGKPSPNKGKSFSLTRFLPSEQSLPM